MNLDTIARLKITLEHVTPVVLRRIEVPLALRLHRLQLAMQAAIGWTTDHCYEIRARDAAWGIPNDVLATAIRLGMPKEIFAEAMKSGALYGSDNGLLDARRARLIDLIEHAGTKRLLGAHNHHRAPIRAGSGRRLSALDRGHGALPAGWNLAGTPNPVRMSSQRCCVSRRSI
jgi:hypothetical protein